MKLNNGTTTRSAPRRSSSRTRTPPRQEVDPRIDISDDFLNSSSKLSEDEEWEPPGSSSRRRTPRLGRGVNDLRSPSPAISFHSTNSSVRTRASAVSDRLSVASSARRRREEERRREQGSENEPHPYGLESRGVDAMSTSTGTPISTPRSSMISSIRLSRQVQVQDSHSVRVSKSQADYEEVRHHRKVTNEAVLGGSLSGGELNNANNNRTESGWYFGKFGRFFGAGLQPEYPFSSDSDNSDHGEMEDGEVTVLQASAAKGSIAKTVWSYCKRLVSYLCSSIYLLLIGGIFIEKWFLRGRPDHEAGEELNGSSYYSHSQDQRHDVNSSSRSRFELFNNSNSSSQKSGSSSSVLFLSSFAGSQSQGEGEDGDFNSGLKQTWWLSQFDRVRQGNGFRTGAGGGGGEEEGLWLGSWFKQWMGYVKQARRTLLYLLLVILLLWVLWMFGRYLTDIAKSVYEFTYASGAALWSTISSGLITKSEFSTGTSTEESRSPALPIIPSVPAPSAAPTPTPTPIPSSVILERDVLLDKTNILQKESKATLAALKLTQDSIDSLRLKIGTMEQTLSDHEARLNVHDASIKTVESDIRKIIEAMEASSAKEKTIPQIIEEVLNVSVGQTTDGTEVTLRSMFSILRQKEDLQRLSAEIEAKLTSLHVDVGSIQGKFDGTADQFQGFEKDLSELNARIASMEGAVEQQRGAQVEVEMDIEKVKQVVLPVLTREIEERVKISCDLRSCPEGSPYFGLSVEDIEEMIRRAIAKYDADKTGLPDLALESAGGSILSTRCTKSSELRNSVISYWGFRLWSPPNTPRTIIQPGVVPGECWAFEGSVGDVVIKLAVPSIVTAFTLEHIPKTISRYGQIDSAPKHFQVLGLLSEHDTEDVHDYGTFIYEDNNEPLQYFPVKNATARPYPIVELKVLSNHGNMKHTCIYRFRVHGAIDLSRSHRLPKPKAADMDPASAASVSSSN